MRGDRSAAGILSRLKLVPKPWGRELWFAETKRYVGKLLIIENSRRLSLQFHRVKRESIYVLRGTLTLIIGDEKKTLRPGQCYEIPPKTRHRFEARRGKVTLVEVSTPETWDIVRISDDFGR